MGAGPSGRGDQDGCVQRLLQLVGEIAVDIGKIAREPDDSARLADHTALQVL
jgi:hypothetical protein